MSSSPGSASWGVDLATESLYSAKRGEYLKRYADAASKASKLVVIWANR
jgi:hypothetical protein